MRVRILVSIGLLAGCLAPLEENSPRELKALPTPEGWAIVRIQGPPGDENATFIVHTTYGSDVGDPRGFHAWVVDDQQRLNYITELSRGWDADFGRSTKNVEYDRWALDIPGFADGETLAVFGWYGLDPPVELRPLDPWVKVTRVEGGEDIWHGDRAYAAASVVEPVEVTIPSETGSLVRLRLRARSGLGEWGIEDGAGLRGDSVNVQGGLFISAIVDGPASAHLSSIPTSATEMYLVSIPLPRDFAPRQLSIAGFPN